ncbi:MAG: leucine-rich repeat domain-containing protein [Lachnospiraceae bacterium]|nr:leucine-rich repeat domain-containing protein [Lachnospiraceae bacterium]
MRSFRKASVVLSILIVGALFICGCSGGSGVKASEGLEFELNDDGTASVCGIGECTDEDLVIPSETPDGVAVTSISADAFKDNDTILSVTIPEGVTTIGPNAFKGSSINSIDFSDTVIEIGAGAFQDSDLLEIVLPANLKVVSARAFAGCMFVTSIVLPDGLEEIGASAFMGCKVNEITIPGSVVSIAADAFMSNPLNIINGMDSLEWCEQNGFRLMNIHLYEAPEDEPGEYVDEAS